MSIELLLMTNVPDLGKEGDVVTVSDGYARNCLLPRKLAAPVSEGMKRRLAKMQQQRDAKRLEELAASRELAKRIEKVSCTITVKTGENDKMFGSVTSQTILDALKAQGVELDKHALLLDEPIRELGVYDVKVRLHPEIQTAIKVWIVEE